MAGRIGSKRLKALQAKVKGAVDLGENLEVSEAGAMTLATTETPKLVLKRTNPGATSTSQVLETTIDFSGTSSLGTTGGTTTGTWASQNAAKVWTASLNIPQYSSVNAIGVYVSSKLSGTGDPGSAGGMNFIDKIGLTSSWGASPSGYDTVALDTYWMSSSNTQDGSRMILSNSGDSAVFFAPSGTLGGYQTATTNIRHWYYTGITSSYITLSVTLASASNSTGSVVFAMYCDTYAAPTG